MTAIRTATHRVLALAWALAVVAGCATPRSDLELLKDSRVTAEPSALPDGIVHAPPRRTAGRPRDASADDGVILASAEEDASPSENNEKQSLKGEPPGRLEKRLEVPKELPGADVQVLRLPRKSAENEDAYDAAIKKLFPSLLDPPTLAAAHPDPARPKLTLGEFEEIALANSPVITQYKSDVTGAVGSAIQAGTHPNPTIGYESDTVGSSQNRDYQGVYVNQIIKTAGKLQLAQAIENVDLMNAQLALRQARYALLTQVRRQYFALLIARESLKINEAVVRFTHEVYRIQVDQVTGGGQAAVYEPMQLRAVAVQARGALWGARNRYIAAWKQLMATLNTPNMPLADLADHPDISVPQVEYDAAVSHVLSMNTEARQARNGPLRARLVLRLAEVTPIPDIYAYITVQKDFTTPGLPHASYNTQFGVPVPIFDRNKGNILTARGFLVRATEEVPRVENDLRSRLADAFERFETNRMLVGYQRDQILPDSVRTYRGTYERHIQSPEDVGFADVIVAQQAMLNSVGVYIGALNGQWSAFVDIAALLQVDTLKELQLELMEKGGEPTPAAETDAPNDVSTMIMKMIDAPQGTVAAARRTAAVGQETPHSVEPYHPEIKTTSAEPEPIPAAPDEALMESAKPE